MRLLALLLAAVVLAGCSGRVDGRAVLGPEVVDPASFFAGDVATYGQTVSANDKTMLAYQRALRRIDVCGLVDRDSLAEIGEISSVGTLLYLNSCDLDVKVPGESDLRYPFVEATMALPVDTPAAFEASGLSVYETYEESCEYLLPLDLSRLPGAQPLRKPSQPYLQIGLLSGTDCAFTGRLAKAVAARIASQPLPGRDGVAAYPFALAERDPCEIVAALGDDVDAWRVGWSGPYECDFDVWRPGLTDVVDIELSLEPQIEDMVTEDLDRRRVDDVDMFVDPESCKAIAFVGPPMQRKLVGGDFIDTGDEFVSRPSVTVYGGSDDADGEVCDTAFDVTARAAKLYA